MEGGVVPTDVREELVALDRVFQGQVLLTCPAVTGGGVIVNVHRV